jgi:hypothetical protein
VGPFKALNSAVNHQGTEHISNTWHLLFQKRLINEQMEQLPDRELGESHSVMAKTVDRSFLFPAEELDTVIELIRQAKSDASYDLARYLLFDPTRPTNDPGTLAIINSINANTKGHGPLPPSHYYLGEGQTQLEPISPAALEFARAHFRSKFANVDSLTEWLLLNFGIGVGFHQVDSHANARMAALEPEQSREVRLFDPHSFQAHLHAASSKRKDLAPLFEGKSEAQLHELFGDLRKYLENLAVEDVSPRLLGELNNLHLKRTGLPLNEYDLPFVLLEVESYVRTINILDFLPMDTISIDPNSRKQFESLGSWRGALYADILRLGARNLTILHQSLDKNLALIDDIAFESERLDRAMNVGIESDSVKAIETKLLNLRAQLIAVRASILNESGLMVNRVHDELINTLGKLGIDRNSFRMVAYGDDIFVVWNKDIDPTTVIKHIRENPFLAERLRLGGMKNTENTQFLTLADARNTIGLTGEAVKKIEAMGLGNPAFIIVSGPFVGKVLFLENGRLVKPSTALNNSIREQLPNWRL